MITTTETREELEALTVADLRRRAAELEVKGRSKLNKTGLIEAILASTAGGPEFAGEAGRGPEPAGDASPSPAAPARRSAAPESVDASQRGSAELLPVDPRRVFACWALDPGLLAELRSERNAPRARLVLRLRDVTLIEFDERRSFGGLDVELAEPSGRCYVDVFPGRSYRGELGLRDGEEFCSLISPLFVETPSETLSPVDREELVGVRGEADARWEGRVGPVPTAAAAESLRRFPAEDSGGGGGNGFAARGVEDRVREGYLPVGRAAERAPSSYDLAAGPSSFDLGLQSLVERAPSSELRIGARLDEETAARLELHADLVIYGRAQPGTKLVIEGVEIPVKDDGTFDLRLALRSGPD